LTEDELISGHPGMGGPGGVSWVFPTLGATVTGLTWSVSVLETSLVVGVLLLPGSIGEAEWDVSPGDLVLCGTEFNISDPVGVSSFSVVVSHSSSWTGWLSFNGVGGRFCVSFLFLE
jgi:hypothetical protein